MRVLRFTVFCRRLLPATAYHTVERGGRGAPRLGCHANPRSSRYGGAVGAGRLADLHVQADPIRARPGATRGRSQRCLRRPVGGLLFLRVNSTSTQIGHRHTFLDRNDFGGVTIRYQAGPKTGQQIHFYTLGELLHLTEAGFEAVTYPYEVIMEHAAPSTGTWSQWEGVWRRKPDGGST